MPLGTVTPMVTLEQVVATAARTSLGVRAFALVDQTKELEEAPIREALDEMERQGVRLEAVARVVRDRLGG